MHIKDFTGWNKVKQGTDKSQNLPSFKEREIWWCKIGVNIGHEVDGKNEFYNRPVLIIKKFNTRLFWGIALSTQIKQDKHYFLIEVQEKKQSAMLSHLRLYDSKRLQGKAIVELPHKPFNELKNAVKDLL